MHKRLLMLFQIIRTNLSAKHTSSGRAPCRHYSGENRVRTALALCLTVGLGVGILANCGGSSSVVTNPSKGSLFTFIGDTPLCDVLSSRFTISGLTVTPLGGGAQVAIISNSSSFKMNLGGLRDFTTILDLSPVQAGTYDQAKITISSQQLGIYNPILSPPTTAIVTRLSTSTPTFSIAPPLVIASGKISALEIDYDMIRSIQLSQAANGSLSASGTPTFQASGLTADPNRGFGEMDDLLGFVRSVNTSSTNPTFIGGFVMQFLSGSLPSGAAVTLSYTTDTAVNGQTVCIPCVKGQADCTSGPNGQFDCSSGPGALNKLLTGNFVEVDGYVDENGNLIARNVEVEFPEDTSQNEVALIGLVTSLRKDPNNNLIGFNLWVRQEEPDDGSSVPLDSIVEVDVSSSTTYQFSSRSANFAYLTFDPTALAVGQEVVVHGPFKLAAIAGTQPTTVAADKVYLKLQSMQGNIISLLQAASDDKTGAFQLSPCCTLLQGAPIYVLTNNQTAFVNVAGLGELNSRSSLLVKGLPFFQPLGGNINGVSVPPGTLVLLAKQVHQLQ